ncbi:MAG: VOC family protein [Mycobacteriales bacterium]
MPHRDTPWPAGTPCWVDYGAADLEAAKAFYAELLGWSFEGGDPEYGGYLTCLADGRAAAGMAPQQDPNDPPKWMTYFASDDVDATAARVTAAGGTLLVEPMDVGPMGRMIVVRDPEGHVFGVWQAGQHLGALIYNEPGALIWNEAAVEDLAAEKAFYTEVFGFRFDEMEGMGGYSTFTTGGDVLGGLGGVSPGAPKGWTACFRVSDVDAAVALVEAGGGKVTLAAQDTTFGRFAVVRDAWGAAFSMMQTS